ncbi:MAG TPA: CHAT domain-containing protein, partial [Blastocatellia bacterium]|nr:CHAT domain-containing protein [Blastocatellia bacterium]
LPIIREVGDRSTEAAILEALGRNHFDLGDYSEALEYHNQSLSLRQSLQERYGEGSALVNIGNVYARMGDRPLALDYFERALRLRREIGDRRGVALTLHNAAELYRESGDLQKALAYFDEGLAISRAIKNRFFEANLLYGIARVEQSLGRFAEARSQVRAGIAIIESARAKVASVDLRASFLALKQDVYEFEIDLSMQMYRRDHDRESLAQAFDANESRRARSLLDSLEEARVNIRQGVAPELLAREHALRAKLNQQAESYVRLFGGKQTPEQAAALAKEVEVLTADYEQVLAEIRTSSPHYAALTQPRPLNLSEIQAQVLDKDTLLLEYSLGEKHSYLWAVTSTSVAAYELPPREKIEGLARRATDLLTARRQAVKFEKGEQRARRIAEADAEYYKVAASLSGMILAPAASLMKKGRLLIVGDGALQYLPFASLPLPQGLSPTRQSAARRPLIERYEVVSLPSASTLALLRREVTDRQPAPRMIAILADPVFEKDDDRLRALHAEKAASSSSDSRRDDGEAHSSESSLSRAVADMSAPGSRLAIRRLPFTRKEAEAIVRIAPPPESKEALDFDASKATATSPALSQYRILHFATHGFVNTAHPYLSGVVLSLFDRNGEPTDGFLTSHEIYNLNLPADLIALSGCRTGLGKEVKGEGLMALTRSFMYAGAARVLVTLWDIDDESTAELMKRFYGAMLGKQRLSPAAALRFAQLSMSRDRHWSAPYFWAGFVLQGEPR